MKDWFEQKEQYDALYRSGREAKDLWRYIPARLVTAVADAFSDPDGYWVYLEQGWCAYDGGEDCGEIHEYTIAGLRNAIKTIRKKANA